MSLLDLNTKEYFVNFEQSTFWIQASGIKHGIIENEKESDIGKFSIKKAGLGKHEIQITDLSDKLIIKATEKSTWSDKWEIKDFKNNIIGISDVKQNQWVLLDKNEKKLLRFNQKGLQGEISELEGKVVPEFLSNEDVKKQGFKFVTKHTYHLKVIDESLDRKILLGFFFTILINNHRGGDYM